MDKRIRNLVKRRIYFGTSSWKYEGWKGLVYQKAYGSQKKFNEQCLTEYAEHFTCVGVDHTYYAWPSVPQMKRYDEQTPDTFRFGLKVTDKITVFKFPKMARFGSEAGGLNSHFLDPGVFRDKFLEPLEALGPKVGPILFEFSYFYPGTVTSGREFVDRLDQFFSDLKAPMDSFFAIEIRNENWLQAPYFDLLKKHRLAHVFNSWTKMPTIGAQLQLAKGERPPALVSRALLQRGTKYETAVEAFSPYDHIQEESSLLRKDCAALVERAMDLGVPAYVFVNNRAEGCAPRTIDGILDCLGKES